MAPIDTLLLLPGLDGTGRLFERVVRELESRVTCIALAYPSDRALGLDELAAYARAAAPEGARYAIVAESFSGPVALKLAVGAPPGLAALVLVASFASSPLGPALNLAARIFAGLLARLPAPDALVAHFLTGGDRELAAEGGAAVATVRPHVLAARLRLLTRLDVRDELRACKLPIAYLAGNRDRLVRPKQVRALASLRPDLLLRWLPAPHFLLQSLPALAARAILELLDAVGAPAR